jgi:cytoskeletal protein CcmA (bactofilin family)
MSWFKPNVAGDTSMSNLGLDARASRAAPDSRLAEFDLKPQAPVAAPPRIEAKPAAEAKPVPEVKPVVEPKLGTTVIGATLRFKGELSGEEDFTFQGRIEGSIHHTQNLTIGTDGVVKGDSRARTIVVEGTVEGDLYALESISIRPTAKVLGNLLAPRVAIADGANFNGKVDMASAARAARSIVDRQAALLDDRAVDQVLAAAAKP